MTGPTTDFPATSPLGCTDCAVISLSLPPSFLQQTYRLRGIVFRPIHRPPMAGVGAGAVGGTEPVSRNTWLRPVSPFVSRGTSHDHTPAWEGGGTALLAWPQSPGPHVHHVHAGVTCVL